MHYRTVVILLYVGFALLEHALGRFRQPEKGKLRDNLIELVSGLGLPFLLVPAVFTLVPTLMDAVVPSAAGSLESWPWWVMFGVLLLADDLTQYLWHRASHTWPWLFRLHRAHHSAAYISVRVTYRNNILYYAMMPGLWLSAGLVHAGFAPVYYWYAVLKMFVVLGAHSNVPWDAFFIRRRYLWPLLWVLERVISTPATHAAHHGRHAVDPATYYKGNYGNFLFLWDVLFGTAKITRRRPVAYGLENIQPVTWLEELLWPFVDLSRSRSKRSG